MAVPERFSGLVVPAFGEAPELRELLRRDLPAGDVTVRVQYSSLNYKDALALTSAGKVLRTLPCVPGIDLAGVVAESDSPRYRVGEAVLVTGCGIGESVWGGYAQYARVSSDWIVPVPDALDTRRAMAVGTAGVAAALSVLALQDRDIAPSSGDILVTGAAGGVGSVAILLLSALDYKVTASTGRSDESDYLRRLGASSVISRAEMSATSKPLESARWAGAVDSVGGATLARILSQMRYGGVAAACGLAGGADLALSVMPFILRAVSLVGINTVETPMPMRLRAWRLIANSLSAAAVDAMTMEHSLAECPELARRLLAGEIRGRTVIAVS